MTAIELKHILLRKISQINDFEILSEVYKLLENCDDDAEVYILSEGHKLAIEEAKAQIDRGEFLTDQQANEEIDQWLNK